MQQTTTTPAARIRRRRQTLFEGGWAGISLAPASRLQLRRSRCLATRPAWAGAPCRRFVAVDQAVCSRH
jgi:hypothetical protein